jgi:hypothetical protein
MQSEMRFRQFPTNAKQNDYRHIRPRPDNQTSVGDRIRSKTLSFIHTAEPVRQCCFQSQN